MANEAQPAATLEAAGSWTNESNFTGTHDTVCMTTTADNDVSGEFSFNFASVTGTIDGIEVMLHRNEGDVNDYHQVELYDSTSTWRLQTVPSNSIADATCGAATDSTVGGPTNLWSGTWTDTHITSSSFRIRVTAQSQGKSGAAWSVDHCTVTVYYTGGAEIPKAMTDVGSGSDVFTQIYREVFMSDSGAGADVFTQIYREMGFADTIDGTDVFETLYRAMGFVDAVAGADVFDLLRFLDFVDVIGGADVWTLTRPMYFTDTVSGADVFDANWKALFVTDSGAGVDVFTIPWKLISKGFVDDVSGADVFALMRFKDFVDSISGADVWNLTRPMYFTDTISGADVFITPYREMGFVDAITGGDVFETLYREMGFADTISGADVFTIPWKLLAKEFADAIGGIDVWTLTRPMYFTDSASGTDVFTQPYREMGFEDVGAGSDVFAITYKELGFEDVGGGLDAFGVMLFRGFTDTVGGVDVWTLTRPIYFTDTGSGSDVFTTPYREMGFTDVGSGTDVFENLLRVMGFADSGTGADIFQFVGIFDVVDTASGTDVFTTPYREMSISDVASGADVFVTPYREMGFSDVGAGAEVFGKSLVTGLIDKDFVDSVSGLDAFTVPFVDLAFADTGSGVDVFTNPFRAMEFIDAGSGTDAYLLVLDMVFADTVTGIDVFSGPLKLVSISEADKIDIADKVWTRILDNVLEGSTGAFLTGMAGDVWEEVQADHLTVGTTGESLSDASTSGDPAIIAAAVWDMVLYPDHVEDDTAGKYLYEFYKLVEAGDVYVSTSTTSEILMVRDRLGDAGVLITETVIDEEAISTDADTVFPAERLLYEVNGVWLSTDTPHAGSNYYEGANGEFDTYTGKIVLHLSLPGDNTDVLLNYTFMRGLPDNVIDQFLVEAKLYVKKYTRKDYDWSLGLGADPDEETQIALLAACSLAAMRCLEAIATGDILQFGYNFRLGDLQVESMTSGGFHVQAHIDFLKNDVERKLAMLGRSMHFVARTTKRWGRGAHGYKRHPGGTRGVY